MMKIFEQHQMHDAMQHAIDGGQAIHLHRIVTGTAPQCFKAAVDRGEWIAHLFDQDIERLSMTAKRCGVRVIVIEHRHCEAQHVDLCGGPLKKAIVAAGGNILHWPKVIAGAQQELFGGAR